ncbi:MAG: hypothetical protein ACI9U2_002885, partial [Bradymonadia bacterium]
MGDDGDPICETECTRLGGSVELCDGIDADGEEALVDRATAGR